MLTVYSTDQAFEVSNVDDNTLQNPLYDLLKARIFWVDTAQGDNLHFDTHLKLVLESAIQKYTDQ